MLCHMKLDLAYWQKQVGAAGRSIRLIFFRCIIQVKGLMMPWRCPLAGVPNGFVYPEVVRRLCPRRLLEPA